MTENQNTEVPSRLAILVEPDPDANQKQDNLDPNLIMMDTAPHFIRYGIIHKHKSLNNEAFHKDELEILQDNLLINPDNQE